MIWSGASISALDSWAVRNEICRFWWRLGGIDSTCAITLACSGCRNAAYLNNDRIAVNLRFLVRGVL